MAALGPKLRRIANSHFAFFCPGCRMMHVIRIGGDRGQGPLWSWSGDEERPTFMPSIYVNRPGRLHNPAVPSCHSYVDAGRIRFLPDSTHALAGQIVDLPDLTAEGSCQTI